MLKRSFTQDGVKIPNAYARIAAQAVAVAVVVAFAFYRILVRVHLAKLRETMVSEWQLIEGGGGGSSEGGVKTSPPAPAFSAFAVGSEPTASPGQVRTDRWDVSAHICAV